MSAHSRKPYFVVFVALAIMTVAEVAVVKVPGIAHGMLISSLVLLALAKAGLVLFYFMHLAGEARALKLTVLTPFLLPAMYAFVLIAEAAWRFLP